MKKMFSLSERLFENGDFCLTDAERRLAETVAENFAKVIVVLNIGGIMETGWIRDDGRISGALLAYQGGVEGGLAAADASGTHQQTASFGEIKEEGIIAHGDDIAFPAAYVQ